MKFVVYGAGGIGGVVGARLVQAGYTTTLIARGEHARVMRSRGLSLVSPQGVETIPVTVVEHPDQIKFDAQTIVLMCMKSQQTQAALADLAAQKGARHCKIVCMQNGVANERLASRFFAHIYASVVNLPASFLTPGEVVTHAQGSGGILDTGRFPEGVDDTAQTICQALTKAGFSARADARVMRQKYAKLLNNLGNILQAGLSDTDNIQAIHRRLRQEALAVYAAAGIGCATRDETRARRQGVYKMATIEGYERTGGSSWQSLARGTGNLETEFLNGEICLLGRMHNVPTPANDCCVELAHELVARGGQPGIFTAARLQRLIDERAGTV